MKTGNEKGKTKRGYEPPRPHLALLLLLILLPAVTLAARSTPVATPRATTWLVTDLDTVQPGHPFRVALQLTLAPGWHTYWHNPGDAGAAPELTLATPGLVTGGMRWPLPQRLPDGPAMSFGYTGRVLLPLQVTYNGASAPILRAHADYLVCEKLCVPEHADFTLGLKLGPESRSSEWPAFEAADATVPQPAPWPSHIAPDGTLWLSGVDRNGAAVFLPDEADTTVLNAPQPVTRHDKTLSIKLTPTGAFHAAEPMTGVLEVGDRGYRLAATPQAAPAAQTSSAWSPLSLLLAFAGGLVLNLMPCVFPILAMKAMGLASLAGQARRNVRLHALAYTAGVMVSFVGIALALLGLRAVGAASGWGFQFQWPPFVGAMAWLFFAIGLALSGAYTIGGSWTGVGQSLTARDGMIGSAATGVLAVLVATPCTAPFMGAALAAAAAAPAAEAIAVFLALGLGFSLPWTLLALAPALAELLPRPGAWMEVLRQAFAFPMYATAVWLVWVLSHEAGSAGVLCVGAGLVLIGVAVWGARIAAANTGAGRRVAQGLVVVAVLCAAAILPSLAKVPSSALANPMAGSDAFSPSRLAALRGQGRPVLVNMTAAWCVTCLVNERTAIEPALPRLRANGVSYLTGDWTSRSQDVSDFLRQYGRVGVPLYVYFPANLPPNQQGHVLPQILTAATVAALR